MFTVLLEVYSHTSYVLTCFLYFSLSHPAMLGFHLILGLLFFLLGYFMSCLLGFVVALDFCFGTGFYTIAQAGLELMTVLLPQLPKY